MRACLFFLTAFFFCCIPITAQKKYSAETIIAQVQKKYSQLNDASADFIQRTKLRFGKSEQVQSGSVKVKKGNKYKIVLQQQELVTDGKTVWAYSGANKQVTIGDFKETSASFSPDKFLKGFPSDFAPSHIEEKEDTLIVSLIPVSAKSQNSMTSLTMWITPGEWIVTAIEYTDRNQTRISASLSNVEFNPGIRDSEFRFIPTDEMKVIDLRTMK